MYIKPVTDGLCESSDDSSDVLSTKSLSIEEVITAKPPDGSFQKLMKDFRDKLQDQYLNNLNTEIITINENNIIESLIQWVKDADDKDLLKHPSIDLVLEE